LELDLVSRDLRQQDQSRWHFHIYKISGDPLYRFKTQEEPDPGPLALPQ